MIKLNFSKLTGGGNDFIIVDGRKREYEFINWQELAKKLCRRCFSIGADGIIVLEPSDKADFYYKHINPDGSIAGICGNGSRCISLYAWMNKVAGRKMSFDTPVGIFKSEVFEGDEQVKVDFIPAKNLRMNIPLESEGFSGTGHFILTGVPHAIIPVKDIENFDVDKAGRPLVYHKEFMPDGANINFVEKIDDKNIRIRTFERGVNYETMACGTGSISSAIVCSIINNTPPPLRMHTQGGMILEIDFALSKDEKGNITGADKITMTGEASFVFEGTINI